MRNKAAAELESPANETAAVAEEKNMSKMTLYRRRFLRNKPAVGGLIIILILVVLAIFGPLMTSYSIADQDLNVLLDGELRKPAMMINQEALSSGTQALLQDATGYAARGGKGIHFFGTDSAGHDLFAQTMHGLGRSLMIALTVSICVVIISALVGTGAAFLGGKPEKAILAVIHFLLVIPSFLLIALLVADSGGDWKVLTLVLILFGWMYQSRIIWSLAMSIREREYIAAARYTGVSGGRIVVRHMIPNIGSLLIINLTLGVVSAVMSETGLSFLGLGVKIPDVSLGTLLQQGAGSVQSLPWTFWFPAVTVTLLTVSMALIADGLRDALDPNSSAGGHA